MTLDFLVSLTGDIDDGSEDLKSCIRPLMETLATYDAKMTFPVTASVLGAHRAKIGYLADRGHEIAGHGDIHEPFIGSVDRQAARLQAMAKAFQEHMGFRPVGFRSPFLAHDENLFLALSQEGFLYDSSRVAHDPLLYARYGLSPERLVHRKHVLNLPRLLARFVSGRAFPRPYQVSPGVIEIPVLDLDDWFFFESARGPRLREEDENLASRIWCSSAKHFRGPGNVLVIQAHPKRMSPKRLHVLETVLEFAAEQKIALATLWKAADHLGHILFASEPRQNGESGSMRVRR